MAAIRALEPHGWGKEDAEKSSSFIGAVSISTRQIPGGSGFSGHGDRLRLGYAREKKERGR